MSNPHSAASTPVPPSASSSFNEHPALSANGSRSALDNVNPALFDVIPALHQLLARLLHTPSADSNHNMYYYTDAAPLEIQGLAPAASMLKIKLQKARNAIRTLPDTDRTVEEQQTEINDLERRIQNLQAILRTLADRVQLEDTLKY